jgi:SAM-dependent methyltransferase
MRSISIDEDGFFIENESRVLNKIFAYDLLSSMRLAPNGSYTAKSENVDYLITAFDQPYIVQSIKNLENSLILEFHYDFEESLNLSSLYADEWDRFHGLLKNNVPFVMSRSAQEDFFELLEKYDDTCVTYNGRTLSILTTYSQNTSQQVQKIPETEVARPLNNMLPRLKLTKARVLVLGCGNGHDAAHFAQEGHLVTAVDSSPQAIAIAKQTYSHLSNLNFICMDAFLLLTEYKQSFDLIFEHYFFSTITPGKRNQLVRLWQQLLSPGGYLMGIFCAVEQRAGPPFGSTEWEIRKRLQNNFRFVFWGRWEQSVESRQGKELFVYAQKKD